MYKKLEDEAAGDVDKLPGFKIKELLLYPIRGLKGISVNKMHLTSHGALLDRILQIVEHKKQRLIDGVRPDYLCLYNSNCDKFGLIRQEIIYDNQEMVNGSLYEDDIDHDQFKMPKFIKISLRDA